MVSCKYIIVAGGVISGTGKGVCGCSIGLLLRLRGHNVTYIKFDPYLNIEASLLAPREHGECFICDDGSECDLDLGHASRILGINVSKDNIATSGTLHKELIEEQERGVFLGSTIQITPHLTDKIQKRLLDLGRNHDIVIAEIGGTVGDNESFAFFEAIRQFKWREGGRYKEDILVSLVAPILYVNTIKEFKTKPLQNSVREIQRHGLQPDVIFCRVDRPCPDKILDKVAMLTNISRSQVFSAPDVPTIYQVPLELYDRQVDDLFVDLFRLNRSRCNIHKYREIVEKYINDSLPTVNIGVFGKYDNCDEAYISLKESLMHAGVANDVKVNILWIKAEDLEKTKEISSYFEKLKGIVIPGGFDNRGIEGKIKAIQYAREKKVPFLGICLGLQTSVIEIARNVCGLDRANSSEFDQSTPYPVVDFIPGQNKLTKKSGTLRLGAYDCELEKDSLAFRLYKKKIISERHRHRYEVNSEYIDVLERNGYKVSGRNPETNLVEIMELSDHPFFIGMQFHGEYKSRLNSPHPLFDGLIKASTGKLN